MQERINLVPRPSLGARLKKITPFVAGTVLLVGCLVVYLLGLRLDSQLEDLRQKNSRITLKKQQVEQQQKLVMTLRQQVEQLEKEKTDLRKLVANLAELGAKKPLYSQFLTGLARILPENVRCEKIVLGERDGQLFGRAVSYRELPQFVKQLERLDEISSADLAVMSQNEVQGTELYTFHVVFSFWPRH